MNDIVNAILLGIVEGLTAGLVFICSLLGGRFYIVARRRVRAV